MKKILFLSNHLTTLSMHRMEIIDKLHRERYHVVLSFPNESPKFSFVGCDVIDTPIKCDGMNAFQDIKTLLHYVKIIHNTKPDIVLTYTIKPNIYGGFASRLCKTPCLCNVTGLGIAEKRGALQKLLFLMLRVSLKKSACVFFQNEENKDIFIKNKIVRKKYKMLPGSGVNLLEFEQLPYEENETINFLYVSRIFKEKGIDLYLNAAKIIKHDYPNTRFMIVGYCEKGYDRTQLDALHNDGVVEFYGAQSDVRAFYGKAHCLVHPTYYPEGLSNVLLEGAACARPLISTDRSGCREVIEDGVNGYIVRPKDGADLIEKIRQFLEVPFEKRKEMGQAGRRKVEQEFDRQIVVDAYMEEIRAVCKEGSASDGL